MKKMSLAVFLAFSVFYLCAGWAFSSDGPIKVGVVLPLTGDQAKFGELQKNSFLMGLEEINNAGGVKGRQIELIIEDDMSRPETGRSAIEKLISQDNVVAITGGYSSAVTFAMGAISQQRKVPFLVTTAAADKITEQGWDYVFRLNPPVSEYPKALYSFLNEIVKPKNVAILHENTLFGQSGAKDFSEQSEKFGIRVLINEGYESGAKDFRPMLIKVKSAKPDFVYMISYVVDASLLMQQAREMNFNTRLFAGSGAGFTLPEFARNAVEASEFVFSVDLWSPNLPYPGAREYFEKYQKRFGATTEYHGAEAYASIYVMADALRRASDISTTAVREALVYTDMMTPFGPVKFVSYGKKKQQNALPTYLVQWQKGVLETVWPKNVATKPYVFPVPEWSAR